VRGVLRSSAGITYIGALVMVIIMGIMMGIAGQTWKMVMQRERETELLFRGLEYQRAIRRWHQVDLVEGKQVQAQGKVQARRPLNDLKDLLKDPTSAGATRYLRRLYLDPVTGEEFEVRRDPAKGIIGVASTSDKEPLKQDGFDQEIAAFQGRKQYREWVFGLAEAVAPAPGTVSGLPGSGATAPAPGSGVSK